MNGGLSNLVLVFILSGVISYFIADMAAEERMLLIGVGCFVSLCVTARPAVSVRFQTERIAFLGRTSSIVFFMASLTVQALYSVMSASSISLYLLLTVGLLTIHALVLSSLSRSGQ